MLNLRSGIDILPVFTIFGIMLFKNTGMKKFSFMYIAASVLACAVLYTSCKKPHHDTNPAPNNFRLLSYTKSITSTTIGGVSANVINHNYRFFYDSAQRVTVILHTANLPTADLSESSVFKYYHDTVIKTTTDVSLNTISEIDTFIHNSAGLITQIYMPNYSATLQYYGKLLANVTEKYYSISRAISIKKQTSYTSVAGDFLKLAYDGKLTAEFFGLTTPLDITWTPFGPTPPTSTPSIRLGVNSYTNTYDKDYGYGGNLSVVDYYSASDGLNFPAVQMPTATYEFYTENTNRTGDLLQLNSFTIFGSNIYQNVHLVEKMYNSGYTTKIDYIIDAYSRINRTTVSTVDSIADKLGEVYNIQYETYE